MTENKIYDNEITANWGLVIFMAKKFKPLGYQDMDDLVQAGFAGLLKGLYTYKEGKGKKSTWLARIIHQEIVDEIWRNHKNSQFRGKNMEIPWGSLSDIEEIIAKDYLHHHSEANMAEEDMILSLDTKKGIPILSDVMSELGERHRAVIETLYGIRGKKLSSYKLGKILNISHTRVCQLHGEALWQLKDKITLKRRGRP